LAHFGGEPKQVALDAKRHVRPQIGVGHQVPAIARLRDGGEQIILLESEQPAGNVRGIRHHATPVLGPEQIAQRAGPEHILIGNLVMRAAAHDQQMRGVLSLNESRRGAQVQK
jgi:hypothetical protein